MIDSIIKGQVEEQKMRYDSIKFKNIEIGKYKNYIKIHEEKKEKIQKEINENEVHINTLKGIKKQLEEALWDGGRGF